MIILENKMIQIYTCLGKICVVQKFYCIVKDARTKQYIPLGHDYKNLSISAAKPKMIF